MDKAEMTEEEEQKKSFKKMRVLPSKKDFVDAILSLKKHDLRGTLVKGYKIKRICKVYVQVLKYAQYSLFDKLSVVLYDFPYEFAPVYEPLLRERFNEGHVYRGLNEVLEAKTVIKEIFKRYVLLLNKNDCDSLDHCKSLKATALGCMFTLAMRCVPILAYLDKVRQYMADVEDDENAAATTTTTLTKKKHDDYDLYAVGEEFKVPRTFDLHEAADFVPPETLHWLQDLEREHGVRLPDDDQLPNDRESLGDLRA